MSDPEQQVALLQSVIQGHRLLLSFVSAIFTSWHPQPPYLSSSSPWRGEECAGPHVEGSCGPGPEAAYGTSHLLDSVAYTHLTRMEAGKNSPPFASSCCGPLALWL